VSAPSASPARDYLGGAWTDFVHGLREAPAHSQRALIGRLFGGTLALLALIAGTAWVLYITFGDGPMPGDLAAFSVVESILSIRRADSVTAMGGSVMLVPVVVVTALLAARHDRPERALSIVVTFVVGKAFTKVGWTFWERARPDGIADSILVPPIPTFPSGHSLQAVVVWGLLGAWWFAAARSPLERSLAAIGSVAIIVVAGLTRIRLNAHWASDVWAAWVFGAIWVGIAVWAERGFTNRHR